MKVLLISDGHGDLARLEQIEPIAATADLVLFGGDFAAFGKPETGLSYLERLAHLHDRVFAVSGNCDEPAFRETMEEFDVSIEGSLSYFNGLMFSGSGGALKFTGVTPNERTDEDLVSDLHLVAESVPEGFSGSDEVWNNLVIITRFANWRLRHLCLCCHDDAVIMLGVLQIVFCHHPVAGTLRVARQRGVFFRNLLGRAANFYIRAIALIITCERVRTPAVLVVVVVIIVTAAATSAHAPVLLWPHSSLFMLKMLSIADGGQNPHALRCSGWRPAAQFAPWSHQFLFRFKSFSEGSPHEAKVSCTPGGSHSFKGNRIDKYCLLRPIRWPEIICNILACQAFFCTAPFCTLIGRRQVRAIHRPDLPCRAES